MGRLKGLKPVVPLLRPRVREAETSPARERDNATPWRTWYKTARWRKLRMAVLIRDLFTCQKCSKVEGNTALLVCDHVEPHRGDEEKFWNGPFQTLCKDCHDRLKQKEEQASRHQGGVWH